MFNLNSFFGCSHKHTTFPQTRRSGAHSSPIPVHDTYIVCLDCGSEFRYDWNKMAVGKQITSRSVCMTAECFSTGNKAQTVGEGILAFWSRI
jgi:hypothetical protein